MQDSLLEIILEPCGQIVGRREHAQNGTGFSVSDPGLVKFPDGLVGKSAGSGVRGTVHLLQESVIQPASKISLIISVVVYNRSQQFQGDQA